MNWVDTPLLVYKLLEDHPAKQRVDQEMAREAWASTVLALSECYQVLVRTYDINPNRAKELLEILAQAPMHWASLDAGQMVKALAERADSGIDTVDAILLHLAESDRGTLVAQDRRLLRMAEAQGVAVRNPISPTLARQIDQWEEQHLPQKGLPRLLTPVEAWIRARDSALADRFRDDTGSLTALPS